MTFLNTFRGRLLVILALLLVATLGVQYYLNLVTQEENNELREAQEQAIVAGIAVGFRSLTSQTDRVQDIMDEPGQTFLGETVRKRIKDIIVIDSNWLVTDAINPDYLPTTGVGDEVIYKRLMDLTELPPVMEGAR